MGVNFKGDINFIKKIDKMDIIKGVINNEEIRGDINLIGGVKDDEREGGEEREEGGERGGRGRIIGEHNLDGVKVGRIKREVGIKRGRER